MTTKAATTQKKTPAAKAPEASAKAAQPQNPNTAAKLPAMSTKVARASLKALQAQRKEQLEQAKAIKNLLNQEKEANKEKRTNRTAHRKLFKEQKAILRNLTTSANSAIKSGSHVEVLSFAERIGEAAALAQEALKNYAENMESFVPEEDDGL